MNPAELANIARLEDSFWWYSGMRTILFGVLDPVFGTQAPGKTLEAGCGTASMALELERRYGAKIYPTDLAAKAIEFARGTNVEQLTQSDVTALPYASRTFDTAVCLDVLVHLRQGCETKAVAELARVLKVNGILVLRVAALNSLRSRHSQFIVEFQRFTRKRLCALLTSSNFSVLRCTYVNSLLMPLALAKFRIWEPLLRKKPESGLATMPVWLNTLFERVLRVEARWLANGHNLPLGQSLIAISRKL
jgi:SAM-dependent methyltransferase